MARTPRQISETGVYHIILRGINKENIFLDTYDKQKMIKELKRTKEKYKYDIYAYCIMTNHIHLLLKDNQSNMSTAIQSFAVSYSSYFNKKYNRTGHLFQNRFKSKCVESESYLLNVQRYIHKNPEKAGICKMEDYYWSSYKEYIEKSDLIDTKKILSLFSENKKEAIKSFKIFNTKENINSQIDDFSEYEIISKLTDEEAKATIEEYLNIKDITKIKNYNFKIRNEMIRELKGMRGTSNRQLSRIIGIDHKIISKILSEDVSPMG